MIEVSSHTDASPLFTNMVDSNKLLFSVFSLLHKLGADDRLEVRNLVIRTLFHNLGSHSQKFSESIWETCLWDYIFPILDHASQMQREIPRKLAVAALKEAKQSHDGDKKIESLKSKVKVHSKELQSEVEIFSSS